MSFVAVYSEISGENDENNQPEINQQALEGQDQHWDGTQTSIEII